MTVTTSTEHSTDSPLLDVVGVDKTFVMHLQDGVELPVLSGLGFRVHRGECVVLDGTSGAGKSSILKMVYGNYGVDRGRILLSGNDGTVDLAATDPRRILAARRNQVGYVSQFLRCVPRVPALQVVAEPLLERGADADVAEERAADLLTRLSIPERLWGLPPATFSGGEQQRVNIARGFLPDLPLLLLDEPTASLDAHNRDVVIDLIREKCSRGTGMLGIFHDSYVRTAVADRLIDVASFTPRPTTQEHNGAVA
ncbi:MULTISPECIES: phosphonate C-P lyase system protein PhnL [Gordonia]|jgi:alpha-D-ribose 1-methylphosphonate 5-triphosphate synthase subunit PhnL|uniref:phosphonate C-P lyase system protein PhnL n=1 Tax=Gordonia TaxID=2053 RepID=UPI0005A6A54B|nr:MULTISPECIES: phosphonate C-P lyase system protein PhnL [Gordonia]MDH3008062.1 phosphonate C-P lyase system protein PhnL [Gordonia alkanivorans]MDH3016879.1 phosphonate C-P lyase system protein PhnL [Gordonia alkanivorans]MDH3020927.1 phosphonate C-P lyase system protein PhnL [Gordonia alkanivorans]MDH3042124.1 phosphonate C-P lyase system protein PhnL [Gordonia alkanivorans]MDH3060218.1 phosphonate C-P lyase system protein PhnL [Gordonia alkanivorans]